MRCSVTGYSFARHLSEQDLLALAERIPEGPSIQALTRTAAAHRITVLAGLFEKDEHDQVYKAYVAVNEHGLLAKYRKLHPFINPHIRPGDAYCVFELAWVDMRHPDLLR